MAELAVNGGKKSNQKGFPVWPQYDDAVRKALQDVLDSRVWWTTPGTRTLAFEQAFAKFHGAKHGIAVTNGTAALEVTVSALGIAASESLGIKVLTQRPVPRRDIWLKTESGSW